MGIKGLHKGLSFCTKKSNIRSFAGQRVAVDSSSWLHKSVYSVSEKYVESTERNIVDPHCVRVSSRYISSRCRELLNNFRLRGVVLVMDGKRCPMKVEENQEREQRRAQNLADARAFNQRCRKDKAEEKYKMCIKIRDNFTRSVMAEVAKSFSNDRRVQFVWSPYEADAQLARLCIDRRADAVITEDSDVLVYSAASQTPFPVIFKLDRSGGSCDVISMDWLLTLQQTNGAKNTANNLEAILMGLSSRQAKRPGFGVRLFVQGCVLAGCDYAPNKLSGIGLVNAFKVIRDNAYRNDEVRVSRVLDSLPRKSKIGLDMKAYEQVLAKSEAVFYYHIVQHIDGSVKPMLEPRLSHGTSEQHKFSDHFPCLQRFEDPAVFLGVSKSVPAETQLPPVLEIHVPEKHTKKRKTLTSIRPVKNPYLDNKKRRTVQVHKPNHELGFSSTNQTKNTTTNQFSQYEMQDVEPQKPLSGLQKYRQNKGDIRFVKRQFPAESDRSHHPKLNCATTIEPSKTPLPEIGLRRHSNPISQNQGRSHPQQLNAKRPPSFQKENHANYLTSSPRQSRESRDSSRQSVLGKENNSLTPNHKCEPTFDYATSEDFGVECSNSGFPLDENHLDATIWEDPLKPAPDILCPPEALNNEQSMESEWMHSSSDRKKTTDNRIDAARTNPSAGETRSEIGGLQCSFSKYFDKGIRRVTLDPSDEPAARLPLHDVVDLSSPSHPSSLLQRKSDTTCGAEAIQVDDWTDDEAIESPESAGIKFGRETSSFTNRYDESRDKKPSSNSFRRQGGPLANAFKKQIEFSSYCSRPPSSRQSKPRTLIGSSGSSRTKHGTRNLKSFFRPVNLPTNQTDDEFLWNC